jgi:hypothetical protein
VFFYLCDVLVWNDFIADLPTPLMPVIHAFVVQLMISWGQTVDGEMVSSRIYIYLSSWCSMLFAQQRNKMIKIINSWFFSVIFQIHCHCILCSVGPCFLLITETDESVFWADEHARGESRVTAADTLHAPRRHWVASGQVGSPQGNKHRGPHAYTSGILMIHVSIDDCSWLGQ